MVDENNSFLPESISMEEFIEQASYEELLRTYSLIVVTGQTEDSHTSQDVADILTGIVEKISPDIEAQFDESGVRFDEQQLLDAVFMQHIQVNSSGMSMGPAPLDAYIQRAYTLSPDIDMSPLTDLGVTIDETNDWWQAINGTMQGNPSAFIGAYVDARMQIFTAEHALSELGDDATEEQIQQAQRELALGQVMLERIERVLPEDMRADAEAAYADAQEHELERLAGELPYQQMGTALYVMGSDLAYNGELLLNGEFAEVGGNVRDGTIALADGAVDGVFELGGLAAGAAAYTINMAPTLAGFEPTFGEEYSAWDTVDAVGSIDDAALGWVYDAAGYELRTDGSFGYLNTTGSLIGGGSFVGKGFSWTGRGMRALSEGARFTDEAADIARAVTRAEDAVPTPHIPPRLALVDDMGDAGEAVVERMTTIPRVTRSAPPAPGPWGPVPTAAPAGMADDAAETALRNTARETAEEVAEETAEAAVERSGNIVTRSVSGAVNRNSPRGIYRSSGSAADRLLRLARSGEQGFDAVDAEKYMGRIINEIGAGRRPISQIELQTLRTSGQFSDEMIARLDDAINASRTAWGRVGYNLKTSLQGTGAITTPLKAAGHITFAPLTAARWAISNPLRMANLPKLGAVWGSVAIDEYAFDGTVRNFLGNSYGALYRGIGKAADTTTGKDISSATTDILAATVDPDQTIAGEAADFLPPKVVETLEKLPVIGPMIGEEHKPLPKDDHESENYDAEADKSRRIRGDFLNAVIPDDGGDWLQLAAGLIAGVNALQGNMISAAALVMVAYFMDDILEFADEFLEAQGLDIIPDKWYQETSAEQGEREPERTVAPPPTVPTPTLGLS